MNIVTKALVVGSVLALGLVSTEALPASPAVNPRDYPKLTDKELGHIRHLVKTAHQLPGDWSGFDSLVLVTERSVQFQVAFSAMTLALAQHQSTPAYREIYQGAIQAYIEKLQHPDIWERWLFSSRGGARGGQQTDMEYGWMDPIAKDNIMLKAYLLQLGAAHDMLYEGNKYDQPGAFTFFYHGQNMGNGYVKFRYTLSDIARIIHQEIVDSNYVGSACEPGRFFWSCQQPSNAGFLHYDHLHGTHYADILPKMKSAWIDKGYIDPETYQFNVAIITSREDRTVELGRYPQAPMVQQAGWAGVFNHVWDAEFVKAAYYGVDGKIRDDMLQSYLTGAYAKVPPGEHIDPPEMLQAMASLAWGWGLAYAAEVGDREAVDKMLAYAERNYHPIWRNGEYYYPRNDDYSVDAQGNSHGVDVSTGSVTIAMGRLNKGGGFYKLYNEPWGEEQYRQPYISDVDTLTTAVSQAFYDQKKGALIVTLNPGPIATKRVQFTVKQLDPTKIYVVTKDGKAIGRLDRKATDHGASAKWREDGSVLISTDIFTAHSFVLSEN